MTMRQTWVERLGLKKNMVVLLAMVVLVGMGEKMAERFLPIYLVALGGGTLSVGLLNGMDNLLSALYSFPGGYASDRLGYKRALLLFNLIAMFGYVIVIVFPYWQAVIVGAVFFLSWTAVSLPATMSMVSQVLPKTQRTMGVSLHSLVRRVPMALGPVVGGIMITQFGEKNGIRLAFVVALLLGGVSLVLQQLVIADEGKKTKKAVRQGSRQAEARPWRMMALMSPALRNLLISDILVRFCEQIPYAFVVLWCVKDVGISPVQFGLLTAVEMVTAMLIYIPVAYLADKSTKKPFVVMTFWFFTFFPLFLLFARSFWLLVLAFVLRGLKEFGEPTRKALIIACARGSQGRDVWGLLSGARHRRVAGGLWRGAAVGQIAPGEFLGRFWFWFVGHAVFCPFWQGPGRGTVAHGLI